MSIREDLKAFIDGEVEPQRAAEIQAALDADPQLRAEADEIRLLGQEIQQLASEPEVFGLERALNAVQPRRSRSPLPMLRLAFAGSAGLLGCLTLLGAAVQFMPPSQFESADQAQMVLASRDGRPAAAAAPAESADANIGGTLRTDSGSATRAQAKPRVKNGGMAGGIFQNSAPAPSYKRAEVPASKGSADPSAEKRSPKVKSMASIPVHDARPSAQVVLQVPDAKLAEKALQTLAADLGGRVERKAVLTDPDAKGGFDLFELHVPSTSFDSAVQGISKLDPSANVLSTNFGDTEFKEQARENSAWAFGGTDKLPSDSQLTENQDSKAEAGDMSGFSGRNEPARRGMNLDGSVRGRTKEMATISVRLEADADEGLKVVEPQGTGAAEATAGTTPEGPHPLMQAGHVVFLWTPLWLPVLGFSWFFARRASLV